MNESAPEGFGPKEWPAWAEGRPREHRGWRVAVGWASLFLLFLIEPVTHAFGPGLPRWLSMLLLVDILVYALCYVGSMYYGPGMSHRNRLFAVVLMTVLGSGIAAILRDPTELTFLTYAIALALMLWPMRWSWPFGFGIALLQVLLEWTLLGHVPWGNTSTLLLLTVGLGTFYRLINTTMILRRTREEVRNLAVADERARLARDLHDVLGHSLTTITVKSGLARRVLESGADRDRAIAEVRDVEDLARQALAEVRATVSGYREASLAAELVGARAALRAAGIAPDLPHAVDDVAAPLQEAFAYVLREAVTNVVRHSGAGSCVVRIGENWIEIRDDGNANISTVDSDVTKGHGLSGLSERLVAVGGAVRAGPASGGGFVVRASAPMQEATGSGAADGGAVADTGASVDHGAAAVGPT